MTKITLSAVDGQGRGTSKDFESTATTIAQTVTDMTALLTDFVGVSGLGTSSYNVLSKQAAVNAVEGPTANKDEACWLVFQMTDGSQISHRIPAPKKTDGEFDFIVGGVVDIENAAVVAYADNFISGPMRLKPGVAATSLVRGYLEK